MAKKKRFADEEWAKFTETQAVRMYEQMIFDDETREIISKAIYNFEGQLEVLESAVGALILGKCLGWQGIRVLHSTQTMKKYETFLGVKFREVLKDRTVFSRRVSGVRLADGFDKFWKALAVGVFGTPEAKLIER
jgi:hypothetical protein